MEESYAEDPGLAGSDRDRGRVGPPTDAAALDAHDDCLSVVCLGTSPAAAALLAETIGTMFPRALVDTLDASSVSTMPEAHVAVIDATAAGGADLDAARDLRGRGFAGTIILVASAIAEDAPTSAAREAVARLGARIVHREEIPRELSDAIVAALALHAAAGPALDDLRRTQRLLAAGEIALRLQHALNNPLAALLVEAQLLEMEPLPSDQAEAAARIVAYTRRAVAEVRRLDGLGPRG